MHHRLALRALALLLPLLCLPDAAAQNSAPLFAGAEHLDSCLVELPLTYAKKDKERYTQAARYLEDVELAYVTYDKKSRTTSCARVFVVVMTSKDGEEFVYIESAKDHLTMGGTKQALFPQYKASTQRFYNAECFDRQLAAHPELKEVLKAEQP